nr:zinc finger CCCH domain-containing protein 34-like [Tanacetum cinerariifolium]
MVTGQLYQEVEGSLEEATWEWMSDSQLSYSPYHFEGKVIFEGVKNVMPWAADDGKKKRVKCYAQDSGRRKRKKDFKHSEYTSDDESPLGTKSKPVDQQVSDDELVGESNDEGVSETLFCAQPSLPCNNNVVEEDPSLSHPPGFTPKVSQQADNHNSIPQKENSTDPICVKEFTPNVHSKVMNFSQETHVNESSGGISSSKQPHNVCNRGSILEVLDDMIRETKMDCISHMDVKFLWGNSNYQFVASDLVGNSGGILCVWEESIFKRDYVSISNNFIAMYGTWLPNNSKLLIVVIYAPQSTVLKWILWDYISGWISRWNGEVIVMGNFNAVRSEDESKLDCFLVSEGIISDFPSITAVCLDRHLSDHRPILLREIHTDFGPCPFWIYHSWFKRDGFDVMVEQAWNSFSHSDPNRLIRFKKKLQDLKKIIRSWIKDKNIAQAGVKKAIIDDLVAIDKNLDKVKDFVQKAKVKWVMEGDDNSKFFHGLINKKWSQLSIRGVFVDSDWHTDPKVVKDTFKEHFAIQFKQPVGSRLKLNISFPKRLSNDQVEILDSCITRAEIRDDVWECGANKSPGPDGYTFEFFRRYWSLIAPDFCSAVDYFFDSGYFPKGSNASFIALIPKVTDAKFVTDFRPMSLIGSVYKVITKILANQMAVVISDLVSDTQSAFVANRQILDGPFVLNELLAWCKRKKKQALIFKVDFPKAYDSVHWDYTSCKLLPLVQIGVNGFAFLKLSKNESLKGSSFKNRILKCFYLASGLKINLQKSQVLGVGIHKDVVNHGASLIGCDVMHTPFTYLGVIVGDHMVRTSAWASIIQKIQAWLSKWKSKTLSVSGRLTLLKLVLGVAPLYTMSIYKVPKGVLHVLESIRSKFFNGDDPSKRKITWIAWEKVLASKKNGGLGVSSLHALNRALLLKWVWRFLSQDGSIWSRVINAIYGSSLASHSVKFSGVILDMPLSVRFPRMFALERDKQIPVAAKWGASSFDASFRRQIRDGIERQQWMDLLSILCTVTLSPSIDRWICDLNGEGIFRVKEIRSILDDLLLPSSSEATRWVKFIPIKINIFAWRVRLDRLPTRCHLLNRGSAVGGIFIGLMSRRLLNGMLGSLVFRCTSRKKRKTHGGTPPVDAGFDQVFLPIPLDQSLLVALVNKENVSETPFDVRLSALRNQTDEQGSSLEFVKGNEVSTAGGEKGYGNDDSNVIIEGHGDTVDDVKARYKECKKELAKIQSAYDENVSTYDQLSKNYDGALTREKSLQDRLEELEEEKKEIKQLSIKQTERIKQLEEALKQSDDDAHQLRLDRETYVVECGNGKMVRRWIINEYLLTFVCHLHQSVEYKRSLGEVFIISVGKGFIDGLSVGRKDEDVRAILRATPGVDPTSSDTFIEEYNKLSDKRYPYVDKVARVYLLDAGWNWSYSCIFVSTMSDPVTEWSDALGLEEPLWKLGLGEDENENENEVYPERPDAADCIYYLRNGVCGYGSRCRFNHPRDRAGSLVGALRGSDGEYPERIGQPVCQYYMRTGLCKFGSSCKYHHPRQGTGSSSPVALNVSGYPLRPGEKECSYYVKTGQCKFGVTCKFHHPQPTSMVPSPAPAVSAGQLSPMPSAIYQNVQSSVISSQPYGLLAGNWPVARPPVLPGSYLPGTYGPMLVPPGMVPFPGWNPYQAPIHPAVSPNPQPILGGGSVYARAIAPYPVGSYVSTLASSSSSSELRPEYNTVGSSFSKSMQISHGGGDAHSN